MGRITRFEEIVAWQKARLLANHVYSLIHKGDLRGDRALLDQIKRAAVSIMANISEGYARRTSKEFVNFLGISHGSIAELQSHLYLALDQGYIKKEDFDGVYTEAEEVSKLIYGFSNYLKTLRIK